MLTLRRLSITLSFVLSAGRAPVALAQAVLGDSTQVVTSGTGHVTLTPDRAVLRAGVGGNGPRAAIASAATTASIRAVVDSLGALGFVRDSIRTIGWSVGPTYDRDSRRINGYVARASVQVTVRDLTALGRVLDAVLGAGARDLESITFESDSVEAGKRQALARAYADARAQAEALATAAGGRLGRLLLVSTEAGREMVSVMQGVMQLQRGFVSSAPITPENVEVQVTVYGRWELRTGPAR